jgi:uncharacterized membrane protein YccC
VDAVSQKYVWPRWMSRRKERMGMDLLDDKAIGIDQRKEGGWTTWTMRPK